MTSHLIPIEDLRSGTVIYRKDAHDFRTGQFAEVQSITDMGLDEGFWVSVLIDGWSEEVGFPVMAGECVELGGRNFSVARTITTKTERAVA